MTADESRGRAESRMWEVVDAAAHAVTDDSTGKFDQKALAGELGHRLADPELAPHIRQAVLDAAASTLATRFLNRRKPKPREEGGALFHPSSVIPLGDGERVWMDQATAADLIKWSSLEVDNLMRVTTAHGRRQHYVNERLVALQDHQGWTLGRIEREVFGYSDTGGDDLGDAEPDDETEDTEAG